MRKKITLFWSWLKIYTLFHLHLRFRNFNQEQIDFFEKIFKPTCKRDENLAKKMIAFNRSKLNNQ